MEHLFKAISDGNRRKILQLLKKGDMTVTDLLAHFDITQPSLSHHLDVLKQAGLVLTRREGQFVICSLNVSVLEELITTLYEYFNVSPDKPNRR
jgi:ArsR family transcriptional regulator